jgi:GT2 family glycosyltransferase
MLGTPFLRFVQSQLDAFREQVARNRALDQLTWVSPVGMMFLLGGEGTPLDMGAPPSERPALRFRIDQKSGADFVIPIVSPGHSIQGLRVSVEGSAAEVPVSLAISRNLTEPPLATRTGRFQSKSSAIEWDLDGIPFESGRRYFLQISAAQPTGLEIAARAFHPADMVTRVQDDVAHAAIVTIVYRDAEHIEAFLEAIYRQTYAGPVTVVIVDDCSPADAFAKFERRIERMRAGTPPNVAIRIIRNPENVGNCLSRNAGIAACAADIYIVIDSDCLINKDFIGAHIAEHRLPDTDAVVGPYNIETYGEDGLALVKQLERERNQILPRSTMQDEQLENAFVNTVTRNFSIKKRWLDKHGVFDPMLSYSRKPESGYGWEDVDIGARIYAAKGTIRYTSQAFSIHLTHESSTAAADKVKGSAQNFR